MLRKIVNKLRHYKSFYIFFAYFKKKLKNKIAIAATPTHSNIGDLAIAVAEFDIVKDCGYTPVEITYSEIKSHFNVFKLLLRNKVVILPGGGNMGDVWYKEELLRRHIISKIKAKKFIIMPQTMYYSNTADGHLKEKESIKIYNKSNVHLMLRDRASYERASNLYVNAKKYLACDVVLSLKYENKNERNGKALLVFRSDAEKKLDSNTVNAVKIFLRDNNILYDEADMYYPDDPIKLDKRLIVLDKLDQFSKYSYVITDRLHGMIFSTITSTRCFAFNNESKKVEGTYELIHSLGYISMCDNYDDFVENFKLTKNKMISRFNVDKISNYCVPLIKRLLN